ncbi:group 1 glycosyl transferase [Pseudomonas sp. M47T1]|uniref:glycosyltransferase family 4 protein n=1 Tax=unclassified Pseudomonas TaxID=196821 RepID=UPI0002606AE2|nr:glycosyltransferase family 1 protein [Pseudomonas sp. M47T1]EIK98694.1 group 1 glycosyl transferase [Pseudomonas sp. M47T1]
MVVINARFLTQELRGVQRFAEQVSLALQARRSDLVFVSPDRILMHDTARKLNVQTLGKYSGHRWEQLDLPRYLHRQGSPLLVSLGATAPLLYRNQIATHHDITYVRHPESYTWAFRTSYRVMTPILLRHLKSLITVSDFSRGEISGYYGYPQERILVVPNAVGSEFQPGIPGNARKTYLLAVSSPSAHKNFTRMIHAFLQLKGHERVELRIVGAASGIFADHSLERLASSDKRIRFLGRLSDEELITQYQGAAAFVFPSLYEGFGIPPLEAQACGCPVLAANAASIPEVLQSSALYFDPLDVEHIAQAMNLVLTNQCIRQQLRTLGLHNVSRFDWDRSAGLINERIDALLAEQSQRHSALPLNAGVPK